MDTKATAYKYVFSPKIGGDTEGVEDFSYSTPPTFCRPLNVLIARVYGLSMCCMDTFLPDTPIRKTGDPGTARLRSKSFRGSGRCFLVNRTGQPRFFSRGLLPMNNIAFRGGINQ